MYVNGVIIGGIGLGSIIYSPFAYRFLNPDKIAPKLGYYIGN